VIQGVARMIRERGSVDFIKMTEEVILWPVTIQ
jgi:hypothetical protein